MSVLIMEMKIPAHCWQCGFKDSEDECMAMYAADRSRCSVMDMWGESKRPEWCPLIELPDHGDLIDRDALTATDSWEWIRHGAPVVIPAERREEGFDGDTWHDLNGATAAPSGMKWQSNGKSRFSGEYMHRLVKKDTGAEKAEAEAEKPKLRSEDGRMKRMSEWIPLPEPYKEGTDDPEG